MALDPANFISELIISGPGAPQGTEDISEGDDQIVTVKRATQQSFPNVDAAVTATAAEMNDQPEKLVDETIGGSWIFNGEVTLGAIVAARLQNDVALEGKEAGDIIARDLLKMTILDEILLGNPANDLKLDALTQIIMQIIGTKVLTLDAAGNNSDVPFKIQGAEYFSGSCVRGGTGFTAQSPNSTGFTFASNVLTHNFGDLDYTCSISVANQASSLFSNKNINDIDGMGVGSNNGNEIEWILVRY